MAPLCFYSYRGFFLTQLLVEIKVDSTIVYELVVANVEKLHSARLIYADGRTYKY